MGKLRFPEVVIIVFTGILKCVLARSVVANHQILVHGRRGQKDPHKSKCAHLGEHGSF